MAQQTINIGTTADDGTGDNARAAGSKINSNFTELYTAVSAPQNVVSVTESATLALGTNILEVNSTSDTTITVPTNAAAAFPVGTKIEVFQVGTGIPTVTAASGVTFQPTGSVPVPGQYKSVFLRKRATNTWAIA